MAIKGLGSARANTKAVFDSIRRRADRAVVAALVTGRSYTLQLVPIDTGNLVNSAFLDTRSSRNGAFGRFGFTADYAAAVHNMPGTLKGQPRGHFGRTGAGIDFGGGTGQGNYWDPGAEPEFLRKGFEDNRAAIDNTVGRVMKL